jgi:hypothetical protein
MRQYAWLDFYRGKWRLLTGKQNDPVRIWMDKQVSLPALAGEGWEISGPYPKRFPIKKKPRERFYGYGRTRVVH